MGLIQRLAAKCLTIPITTAPGTTPVNSGFKLPRGALLIDVAVETTVVDALSPVVSFNVGNAACVNVYASGNGNSGVIDASCTNLENFSRGGYLNDGAHPCNFLVFSAADQDVYYSATGAGLTTWRGNIHLFYIAAAVA